MQYRPKQQVAVNLGTRNGEPRGVLAKFVQAAGKKKLLLRGEDGARFEARNEDVYQTRADLEDAVPGIVFPVAALAPTARMPAPSRHSPIKGGYSKRQIADAVHFGVCQFTQSDGFGHCHRYAACGLATLIRLGVKRPMIQAGELRLYGDPTDPTRCLAMDPEFGETPVILVWVAIAYVDARGRPREGGDHQVVDFAARHYRNYFERLNLISAPETLAWKRPEGPPDFVWAAPRDIPEWVMLRVQGRASESVLSNLNAREAAQMSALAMAYLSTQRPMAYLSTQRPNAA
jgi:hypothetical protein